MVERFGSDAVVSVLYQDKQKVQQDYEMEMANIFHLLTAGQLSASFGVDIGDSPLGRLVCHHMAQITWNRAFDGYILRIEMEGDGDRSNTEVPRVTEPVIEPSLSLR